MKIISECIFSPKTIFENLKLILFSFNEIKKLYLLLKGKK